MWRGDFGIDDIRVARNMLNSIVLLDNYAKYWTISMITLRSRYEKILYEVRFLKYHFIFLLVILFPMLLKLIFLQASVVRSVAEHKM